MQHPSQIRIADYTYDLPDDRIAQYPLSARDQSKLLVFRDGNITEKQFSGIAEVLPADTLLIFNNTKVIPARLKYQTAAGHPVEIFCLEPAEQGLTPAQGLASKSRARWNCLVGNLRRWKEPLLKKTEGELELRASIAEKKEGYCLIEFEWNRPGLRFGELLAQFGAMPLPPYMNREAEQKDQESYQTLFSEKSGSVAAPTAGLHFTPAVLGSLIARGIQTEHVTLHVGAGTFKPVKSELLAGHQMHHEWMEVDRKLLASLCAHKGSVAAVGTTSLRTLESLYWMGVKTMLKPGISLTELELNQWEVYDLSADAGREEALRSLGEWMERQGSEKLICRTSILIAPPYRLRIADVLVTNFHQPQSTLLLLVAAIIGKSWRSVYSYALGHDYRFLSYGDASVLFAK